MIICFYLLYVKNADMLSIYNRYKKLRKYQNGKNAIFECWQGVLFLIKVGPFETLNPLNFQKNKVNLKI